MKNNTTTIYLSDNRRLEQTKVHRSFSTSFRSEEPLAPHPTSHRTYKVEDVELLAKATLTRFIEQPTALFILPITGDLDCSFPFGSIWRVEIGGMQQLNLSAGECVLISNPFEKEIINFLTIYIQSSVLTAGNAIFSFDLEANNDKLIPVITPEVNLSVSIGRFGARKQGHYFPNAKSGQLVIFTIAGAFEVENRLLQPRDALELQATKRIEFEALSEGAVLLVVESVATV